MIKQLLDKIFFTIGVIVFLQLPHFIDQYTQRIGGYAESMQQQLKQYQSIANRNDGGDLGQLIERFESSEDPAVRETGNNIRFAQIDVEKINDEVETLSQDSLLQKTLFLMTNVRVNIVKGTLSAFQPGVPLNLWALLYGLLGGVLFSLIFNGCTKVPKLVSRRKKRTSIYAN